MLCVKCCVLCDMCCLSGVVVVYVVVDVYVIDINDGIVDYIVVDDVACCC